MKKLNVIFVFKENAAQYPDKKRLKVHENARLKPDKEYLELIASKNMCRQSVIM